MTPDEVLAMLRNAVGTVLEIDPATVTRDSRFAEDLHADSLAIVEIVEILEEQLVAATSDAFSIDDEKLDDLLTVGDAVDHAVSRL